MVTEIPNLSQFWTLKPKKRKVKGVKKPRDSTFIPEPSSFSENHSQNGVPSKEVHSEGTSKNRHLAEDFMGGMESGSVDGGDHPPILRPTVTIPSPCTLEGHPAGMMDVSMGHCDDGGGSKTPRGASLGEPSMLREGAEADLCCKANLHGLGVASGPSSEVEGVRNLPASHGVGLFIGQDDDDGGVWAAAHRTPEWSESSSSQWPAHSAINPQDGGNFSTSTQSNPDSKSALMGDFHRQARPVHQRRTSHQVVPMEPWMGRGLVSIRRRTLMPNAGSSPAHSFLTRGQGGEDLLETRDDHQLKGGDSPPCHFFPETWTVRKLSFDEGAIESFKEFHDPTEHSWFFGEFLVRHYLRTTR